MEPVSLTIAGVAGIALTEGVKFLYAEAGDLLKRWLDSKQKPGTDRELQVDIRLPDAFDGQLRRATVAPATFTKNESVLADAHQRLSLYASGIKPIDPSDSELLKSVSELRNVLERILGQTLTLKGEQRPRSGTPVVRGTLAAGTVSGEAAGVRAKSARSGLIEGTAEVERVTEGGRVAAVDIDEIGT
jgi:hypothetical protein